jgi:hypothetical protein
MITGVGIASLLLLILGLLIAVLHINNESFEMVSWFFHFCVCYYFIETKDDVANSSIVCRFDS